jgi:hypothetical protein
VGGRPRPTIRFNGLLGSTSTLSWMLWTTYINDGSVSRPWIKECAVSAAPQKYAQVAIPLDTRERCADANGTPVRVSRRTAGRTQWALVARSPEILIHGRLACRRSPLRCWLWIGRLLDRRGCGPLATACARRDKQDDGEQNPRARDSVSVIVLNTSHLCLPNALPFSGEPAARTVR